jgi:hypothetical protein
VDDSAQVEYATHHTGFIHGRNFFLAEELRNAFPCKEKTLSLRHIILKNNNNKNFHLKLGCTVSDEVIPTTNIKSGPVKSMTEKLGNGIHSFRCKTHQEISRDEIKRLEQVLRRVVSNVDCTRAGELHHRQYASHNPRY